MGSFVAADASALTTSITTLTGVTWPAHTAHDVALVGWASDNTQTRTEPPTGFTSRFTNADGSLRAIVASLDSTGSESGDVSLVCGGANRQAGAIALYRGYSATITNITSLAEPLASAVTSHNSPSITPTDSGSGIVLIYTDRVTSSVVPTAPAGYTVRASFATGGSGGTTVVIADKLSGLTAGVAENPAAWTGATASLTAYVIALELVPSGISGTAAVTVSPDTLSATGQLGYTGTSAVTEATDTSAASGLLGYSGTSSGTQSGQTSSASGQLGYTGTSARTQATQTSTASGTFTVAGVIGTATATQAPETSAASGVLGYTGTSSKTQAGQTSAASGILGYSGTSARTQGNQIASASGSAINPVVGTAAVTQASQASAASGVLVYVATATLSQEADSASAVGLYFVPVIATADITQDDQTAEAAGIALGRTIVRPDLGITSRTSDGVTPRPFAGTTPRP